MSTAYTGTLMETGIWHAEQRIQYATLTLYHNIKNSDEERKIKLIEKTVDKRTFEKGLQQHFVQKSTADSRNLGDWNRQGNRQEKLT